MAAFSGCFGTFPSIGNYHVYRDDAMMTYCRVGESEATRVDLTSKVRSRCNRGSTRRPAMEGSSSILFFVVVVTFDQFDRFDEDQFLQAWRIGETFFFPEIAKAS